jgi:hypothetical protein
MICIGGEDGDISSGDRCQESSQNSRSGHESAFPDIVVIELTISVICQVMIDQKITKKKRRDLERHFSVLFHRDKCFDARHFGRCIL